MQNCNDDETLSSFKSSSWICSRPVWRKCSHGECGDRLGCAAHIQPSWHAHTLLHRHQGGETQWQLSIVIIIGPHIIRPHSWIWAAAPTLSRAGTLAWIGSGWVFCGECCTCCRLRGNVLFRKREAHSMVTIRSWAHTKGKHLPSQ